MTRPTDRVLDHLDHPRNAGRIDEADVVGQSSLDGRAPYTHMYLQIREDRVSAVRFQTFGCGFSIAACSVVTELAHGRTTSACLEITPAEVVGCLGHVPEEKGFCVDLAVQALRDAIRQWQCKLETGR